MLILWLDLHKAMREARAVRKAPWETDETDVAKLWDQITHPKNHHALEDWLMQSGSGEPERWAQQALLTCRKRARSGEQK